MPRQRRTSCPVHGADFRRHADGRCAECQNDAARARWAALGEDERWRLRRNHGLMHKFGITIEDYEAKAAAQGDRCAICGGVVQEHRQHLDVDHNHETGQVRGLLCSPCNRAIGYLRDDPALLRAAAEYLEKWQAEA